MKVWIINPYGNVPGEGWKLHRSYMIAEALSENKHNVTYFVSNIDHRSKKKRSESYIDYKTAENLKIQIIPTIRYTEHISIRRIKSEVTFIRNLRKLVLAEIDGPDTIIIGEPALFISISVIKIVKKFKALLVVDFIDLWPELFAIAIPQFLLPFRNVILAPLFWKRSWFLRKADALISVSEAYMKIGKKYNKIVPSKVIYWGVDLNEFRNSQNNSVLINHGLHKKTGNEVWIIYAGTLGDNYDIRTIIEFARIINESDIEIRLIIAGDGNLKEFVSGSILKFKSGKSLFLGRLSSNDLHEIYKYCDISLSTYVPGSTVSMPIKAFDYFAAGLPLINSLGMDLGYFVETRKVGLQYEPGNPKNMFEKAMEFYNNRTLLSEMKKNCLELAIEFDQRNLYRKYVEFVEDLI